MKISGRAVVFEVFYPFHKDRLEEPRNRKVVELGLEKVFGVPLAFECVLGKSKKPALVINNDTPVETVGVTDKKDIYDVAKEIFG
jgi:hypothetical protein